MDTPKFVMVKPEHLRAGDEYIRRYDGARLLITSIRDEYHPVLHTMQRRYATVHNLSTGAAEEVEFSVAISSLVEVRGGEKLAGGLDHGYLEWIKGMNRWHYVAVGA